jgi:hypothetical protein
VVRHVRVTEVVRTPVVVNRTARGAYVQVSSLCGEAAAHAKNGCDVVTGGPSACNAGCPTYDCAAPGRVFVEGIPVNREVPVTTTKCVQVTEIRRVPQQVTKCVPYEVVKLVPTKVTVMKQEVVCKKVPYTVCKQVPYTVQVRVPCQVTEMVPCTVTKRVPVQVPCKVVVKKPRYVPAPCNNGGCNSGPCTNGGCNGAPCNACNGPCGNAAKCGACNACNACEKPCKPARWKSAKSCGCDTCGNAGCAPVCQSAVGCGVRDVCSGSCKSHRIRDFLKGLCSNRLACEPCPPANCCTPCELPCK